MESWKVNLISVWFGCFFTGLAISQILPFLPLYVSQLGVTSHEALSMWSGLTFSVTFLVSAIVSPMWGSLADRKGRKLMLLRASLGMAIAILLQAFATNVWQLFFLRAVMGLTSGYIPNAMALVAPQAAPHTHLRAQEKRGKLVFRPLLEKKKQLMNQYPLFLILEKELL
ncbi:MFS transporter [Enterobacter asburiae]